MQKGNQFKKNQTGKITNLMEDNMSNVSKSNEQDNINLTDLMEDEMEETTKTEEKEMEKQKEIKEAELNEIRSITTRLSVLVTDRELATIRMENYIHHVLNLKDAIKDKKNKWKLKDLLREKLIYLRKALKETEKLLDIVHREINDTKKLLVRIRQDYKEVVRRKLISLEEGVKFLEKLLDKLNSDIHETTDQVMINEESIAYDK